MSAAVSNMIVPTIEEATSTEFSKFKRNYHSTQKYTRNALCNHYIILQRIQETLERTEIKLDNLSDRVVKIEQTTFCKGFKVALWNSFAKIFGIKEKKGK